MSKSFVFAAAMLALGTLASPVFAANFDVKMLSTGTDGSKMVFEPALTKVQPGDTVTFIATDKGHNAQSVKDMLPEGAEAFKGAINKDITVTFTVPGAYGVECLPHFGMGMVALVVVGDVPPANLAALQAVKVPAKAKAKFDTLFAEIAQ